MDPSSISINWSCARADDRRVLARAAGGRIAADVWQLLQNGKLFALRVELDAPTIAIERLGPTRFALASEIVWGGEPSSLSQIALNDLPAGTLVIRRGVVVLQDWNAALPRLELRDVDFDATRVTHFVSASLSAQLPAQLGGRLSVSGTGRGAERIAELRLERARECERDVISPAGASCCPSI